MSYRTNPDRILDSIDRQRSRESEGGGPGPVRQASNRELDTDVPGERVTQKERLTRIFQAIERSYMRTAQTADLRKMAARFQTIGDIGNHHARGDVSVSIQYLDSERPDDVGMTPFEVRPDEVEEAREETNSKRADVNALKVLRGHLREGVLGSYRKLEPRIREAVKEGADLGHVSVEVTVDLRPAG